jgi:hypothetical protein
MPQLPFNASLTRAGQPDVKPMPARDELFAVLDAAAPTRSAGVIGIFGDVNVAQHLEQELMSNSPMPLRTRYQRRIIGVTVSAANMPSYMRPWQYLLSTVLDRIVDLALPNEREQIGRLRSQLLNLVRQNATASTDELQRANLDFSQRFNATYPVLIYNIIVQANAILLIGLEQLTDAESADVEELLESCAYFLCVPGSAVIVADDENQLHAKLGERDRLGRIVRTRIIARASPEPVAPPPTPTTTAVTQTISIPPVLPTIEKATEPIRPLQRETIITDITELPKPQPIEPVVMAQPVVAAPVVESTRPILPTQVLANEAINQVEPAPIRKRTREIVTRPASPLWSALRLPLILSASVFVIDRIAKLIANASGAAIAANVTAGGLRIGLSIALEIAGVIAALLLLVFSVNRSGDEPAEYRPTIKLRRIAYALIGGGLIANLADHLFVGDVINMIRIGNLFAINLAHIVLLAGLLLLVYSLVRPTLSED